MRAKTRSTFAMLGLVAKRKHLFLVPEPIQLNQSKNLKLDWLESI
jgi:hypothetical protein